MSDDVTTRRPLAGETYVGWRVRRYDDRDIRDGIVVRPFDHPDMRGWVVVAHVQFGRQVEECMYPPLIEWEKR